MDEQQGIFILNAIPVMILALTDDSNAHILLIGLLDIHSAGAHFKVQSPQCIDCQTRSLPGHHTIHGIICIF